MYIKMYICHVNLSFGASLLFLFLLLFCVRKIFLFLFFGFYAIKKIWCFFSSLIFSDFSYKIVLQLFVPSALSFYSCDFCRYFSHIWNYVWILQKVDDNVDEKRRKTNVRKKEREKEDGILRNDVLSFKY